MLFHVLWIEIWTLRVIWIRTILLWHRVATRWTLVHWMTSWRTTLIHRMLHALGWWATSRWSIWLWTVWRLSRWSIHWSHMWTLNIWVLTRMTWHWWLAHSHWRLSWSRSSRSTNRCWTSLLSSKWWHLLLLIHLRVIIWIIWV